MKIQFRIFIFLTVLSSLSISCNKNERQAEKSIEGEWAITEITSYYGEFLAYGVNFNLTETVEDKGELGSFVFTENLVDFSFNRNDTLFTGSHSWTLTHEKVREGFFRVPDFTLKIEEEFLFDVMFEDETTNSERNATNVMFRETPTDEGFGVMIEFTLEKQ